MKVQDLERRIVKLEERVAQLSNRAPRSGAWYLQHAGQFEGDAVYDEIVRRGRAYRRGLRPKQRGKKKR